MLKKCIQSFREENYVKIKIKSGNIAGVENMVITNFEIEN